MNTDINSLSLKELRDLQSVVAKAITSFEERKKKAAIAELEEKAREMGFSWAELTGAPSPANAARPPPNMPTPPMPPTPGQAGAASRAGSSRRWRRARSRTIWRSDQAAPGLHWESLVRPGF